MSGKVPDKSPAKIIYKVGIKNLVTGLTVIERTVPKSEVFNTGETVSKWFDDHDTFAELKLAIWEYWKNDGFVKIIEIYIHPEGKYRYANRIVLHVLVFGNGEQPQMHEFFVERKTKAV